MAKNRKNVYTCPAAHKTYTVDSDDGVAPISIRCPREGCRRQANSAFYQIEQIGVKPTHEFYRPANMSGLTPAEIAFVDDGGLLFRKL